MGWCGCKGGGGEGGRGVVEGGETVGKRNRRCVTLLMGERVLMSKPFLGEVAKRW